jgi:hypothetical protein
VGTLGPFVQGSSRSLALRLKVAIAFGVAFLAGAVAIFAIAFFLGFALRLSYLPVAWRHGIAATGLVALASIDVLAIRKGAYCLIGLRRQTPKSLMHRHSAVSVAATWGFDTGLAVTTIRVAAITWGALVLAFLGISGWRIGIGYGLGFVVPHTILLWTHPVGRKSTSKTPADPGLEALLSKRPVMQLGSAALLSAAGVVLILEILA